MHKPFAIPTSQGNFSKTFSSGNFRKVTLILIFLSNALVSLAQAPQKFSFQGVARNSEGKFITNKSIKLRMTIRFEKPEGKSFYQETHQVTTTAGGIFTVSIGGGTKLSGDFSAIDWKSASHFLQVELDAEGGGNFVDMGTTQMLSVPYAQIANEAGKWQDGYPVVQKMATGADIDLNDPDAANDPDFQKYLLKSVGKGERFIWYPFKGAFRAGYAGEFKWEDDQIGSYSAAIGYDNRASGFGSFVSGLSSQATGANSLAVGNMVTSQGAASISLGDGTIATGSASIALGLQTWSRVEGSFVAGLYNDISDVPTNEKLGTDRIFQIGNGYADFDLNQSIRSNAITTLRSGFTGIGNNAIDPKFMLDVGGRARIQHNGETAGIYFNNSANATAGFVGMVNDNEVGFFVGGGWKFHVRANGNATLVGALTQNSDRRLKRNLVPLSASLTKISALNGYQYFWKDSQRDQSLQTGLIAQEVETSFPELVETDSDGYKSVNYTGLIPHLIESIKDLKAEIETLKKGKE